MAIWKDSTARVAPPPPAAEREPTRYEPPKP
jgi:hypothetical protein